ncbi:MAG: hypothetical protein CVU64_01935 [Deltaproteobacteria bacterium HGW-Deltaproteobacteria-21]|nr:MAG: hypothetical protein CVU64_01935 [Deltaproteobacteria bacterium HGW-Deltaproteobacteria-21]
MLESMERILKEGRNCWRILPAARTAFLVDGASYFDAFFRSALKAEKSILITGWDIDSRIRLFPENEREGFPAVLSEFLLALAKRKKKLQIHILGWDFAAIYVFERELFPVFRLPWRKHRRIHFYLDGKHPLGGSQHQKVIVIDDSIAFVGGMDLTKGRWDTPDHQVYNPRRVDPNGKLYGPFHDVQMAVDGEAARALGDLVRARWHRARGKVIRPPEKPGSDPWPAELAPALRDIPVALVRTEPAYNGRGAVKEVETLYMDSFGAAREFIYMENQYLSSFSIGKALAENLRKEKGPEIVLVLRAGSEWLEETTMGVFRAKLLARIREADVHGRLKVYYPTAPGIDGRGINVHSKLMVVDDTFVRVGSSNLSNRSMAVDAECDLAFESLGQERIEKTIRDFRTSLLCEHLGVRSEEFHRTFAAEGSLIKAVEKLRGGSRTLVPFPKEELSWTSDLLPDTTIDPIEPIDPEKLLYEFMPEEVSRKGPRKLLRFVILLLVLIGLAAAWQWTPLKELVNLDTISAAGKYLHSTGMAPVIVLAGYVIGSLIMFPVTIMIVATAFMFGPVSGFFYSLFGCLLAAVVTYGIGWLLGRKVVSRLAGSRLNRLSRRLARHGVLVVTTARILPLAPFTVVNMVAGASHIRFYEYVLGTLIGMTPGITAATIFERQLEAAIRQPDIESLAALGVIAALIVGAVLIVKSRFFASRGEEG